MKTNHVAEVVTSDQVRTENWLVYTFFTHYMNLIYSSVTALIYFNPC